MTFQQFLGYAIAITVIILLWEFVKAIFKNIRKLIRNRRFKKSLKRKKEFPQYKPIQENLNNPAHRID